MVDYKAFASVADSLRDKYRFVAVADSSVVPEGAKFQVYRSFDEPAEFTGELTVAGATAFIAQASTPLWGELTAENARDYMERKLPLLLMFMGPEELKDPKSVLAPLLPVAADHSDAFAFAYLSKFVPLDDVHFSTHLQFFAPQ